MPLDKRILAAQPYRLLPRTPTRNSAPGDTDFLNPGLALPAFVPFILTASAPSLHCRTLHAFCPTTSSEIFTAQPPRFCCWHLWELISHDSAHFMGPTKSLSIHIAVHRALSSFLNSGPSAAVPQELPIIPFKAQYKWSPCIQSLPLPLQRAIAVFCAAETSDSVTSYKKSNSGLSASVWERDYIGEPKTVTRATAKELRDSAHTAAASCGLETDDGAGVDAHQPRCKLRGCE